MSYRLLFFSLLFSSLWSQNLNPALIQQINKLNQEQLKARLQSQNQSGIQNQAKSINDNQRNTDLSLQSDADRIAEIERLSESQKQDVFFGESFFRNVKIAPKTYGPVPDSYRLGPGDELLITVYGEVQLYHELIIDRDNNIFPETVGRINLGGETFASAKAKIQRAYSRSYSTLNGRNPKSRINITVGRHRKITVSVLGEVKFPKTLILSGLNTVFDAVVMAGGPTDEAALRRVEIKRGGQTIYHDMYGDFLPSLKQETIRLQNNDVIYVSASKKVIKLDGAVRRPGTYEISDRSRIREMVSIAGGVKVTGSMNYLTVSTIRSDRTIALAFDSLSQRDRYILQDGDVIVANEKEIAFVSKVEISGSVLYPGDYAWKTGKTVQDYVKMAGGFKDFTNQQRIQVLRKLNTKEYQAYTLTKAEINTFRIEDGDVIEIFSELDFIDERFVYLISYEQGFFKFNYARNSSVYDYISKVGGFRYTEDSSFVEIVRLTNSDPNHYAKEFRISVNRNFMNAASERKNRFQLQPDDIIIIRKNPDFDSFQTVKLYGEVQSVGSYPIVKREERIFSIIKRAQGFKASAYLDGIRFFRRKTTDFTFKTDTLDTLPYIRIPIDFRNVMRDPGSVDNIIVTDLDSIYVPKNPNTVIVQGEVNSPQPVIFISGMDVEYYINQAGGLTAYGDGNRIQVIKANGKHLRSGLFSSDQVNAGTVITVPRQRTDVNEYQVLTTVVQTISALVTTLVLIRQL